LTLQINAPSGGVGHRTGLRGGGPLSTLILGEPPSSLWRNLWLNVQERSAFLRHGEAAKMAPHFTFPWLAEITALQHEEGELAPTQLHPAHVFWAMPRRIRLDCTALSEGECDICHRKSDRVIRQYVTKNYGLNYKGAWDHPLSPYYETKEGWLPLHPQPGGFGYRHWLAWLCGTLPSAGKNQRPARVVVHLLEHHYREVPVQLRLWAFGYDMDNAKARCWYESTLPLYGLASCQRDALKRIQSEVGIWLAGAQMTVYFLRRAVKDAWFSRDARGDLSAIDAEFWSRTESDFYLQIKDLIEGVRSDPDLDTSSVRAAWHRVLKHTSLALFDRFVGTSSIERQNPRRVALAFHQLERNLRGPKIRQAAGLPPVDSDRVKAGRHSAENAA
jgi:CRISPR system Cascade subunit CasA